MPTTKQVWKTWNLNSIGLGNIDKTGVTKFGARFLYGDITGEETGFIAHVITGPSDVGFEPKLVIIYSPPVTTIRRKIII